MDGLDELLSFPSGIDQDGGAIDGAFIVLKREDVDKKKTDKTINIHTTPIIMTDNAPSAVPEVAEISAFIGSTGVQPNYILAFNGEAVRKLLTNPNDRSKDINERLFMIRTGQSYSGLDQLIIKQVAFLCFFHHLFFLAKLANYTSFPTFADTFSDKFMAIQQKVGEQTKSKTEIFGIPTADIVSFWEDLKKALAFETNNTVFTMLELISKSPEEIYNYFIDQTSASAAAAPAAPAPAAAAPAAKPSGSIVTAPGATSMTTSQGFAAASITSGSQGSKPSPVAPKKLLPADTGLMPQVEKVIEGKFAASGRPAAPTAAAIAAATGRPQRAAAAASQASTAKLAASLKPRISAAASEHIATNQNKEPTDEERKQAETLQQQEDAKKAAAFQAAVKASSLSSIKEANKEENSNNNTDSLTTVP